MDDTTSALTIIDLGVDLNANVPCVHPGHGVQYYYRLVGPSKQRVRFIGHLSSESATWRIRLFTPDGHSSTLTVCDVYKRHAEIIFGAGSQSTVPYICGCGTKFAPREIRVEFKEI